MEAAKATEQKRVECEFYAKLIAVLLFNRISGLVEEFAGEKISPIKLWRQMRDDREDWLRALGRGTARALSQALKFLARFALPSRRKKYPSTLQRLALAGRAAQQGRPSLGYRTSLATRSGRAASASIAASSEASRSFASIASTSS